MRLHFHYGSICTSRFRNIQFRMRVLCVTFSSHTHNSFHNGIKRHKLNSQALVLIFRSLAIVFQHLLAVQVHVAAEQLNLPAVGKVASMMNSKERSHISTPVMLILETRSYGMLVSSCTSRCMLSNNSPTITSEGVTAASS